MDFKLELVILPVTDIDRAKAFYTEQLGFNLDVDHDISEDFRVVQMTPPGSACSITIGRGMTTATPGSYMGTHLFDQGQRTPGVDPQHATYNSFANFSDLDGNGWVLQEVNYRPA
jgi:catechol 2,3-dioxygenase-like lactoylglutathione lyase family enzyme